MLWLLAAACAPPRPEVIRHGHENEQEQEHEKTSAPSAEEGAEPMQEEPTDAENPDTLLSIDPNGSYFIGTLYENAPFDPTLPDGYCLEDGQRYRGATHRLGRQNLFGLDAIDPSLSFQTVLVRGEVRTPLTDKLVADGPCPPDDSPERQFRSDWMSDEGGYRTTREKLESVSYVWASSVEAISLLTIDDPNPQRPRKMRLGAAEEDGPAGQDITLTVQNPLSIELSDLVLLVHYEGGRGKPMPKYEPHHFSLAPGEARAFVVPPGIEETLDEGRLVGWTYAGAHLVCRKGPVRILPSAYFQLPEELGE
ncbi:MAG: hypothetical protein COW42_15460 [Deltaproteobacteria bacterium CG17_big_fil_post_rev_8_21_14_2_50_63_7]|nr:MAG: hypothetical protein COW42_15460 [Deltaproteobacteria bacterium CG17_big_fil_post_rev_8_21_14_2_50_63_7]